MATIKVSELRPAGSDLFSDSESYMTELVDSELNNITGGGITGKIVKLGQKLFAKSTERCAKATVKITRIQTPNISMFC